MSFLQEKILELCSEEDTGVSEINGIYKSYSEILLSSKKYSNVLSEFNGEIVTVVLVNSVDYIEVMIACILTGNVFNPIPYFTSSNELQKIITFINPVLCITDRKDLGNDLDASKIYSIEYFGVPSEEAAQVINKGDTVAALYYSSGTTSSPKGVMYTHDNIYYLISSINRGFNFKKETKHLAVLPFGHTASINYNIYPCLFNASPLVVADSFSSILPNFFNILSEEKINYVQLVPTIIHMLLKVSFNISGLDFRALDFVGCGSSILPVESQNNFHAKYGLKVANLYGLSETGPSHLDYPLEPGWEPGSIGKALDVNECKLTDDSELLIKGRNVFCGYYKNQKLYDEVVKDGWFHTGDIVAYDKDIYYFKDRKKDLIIKGGINIVPGEIEEIIYKCEYVLEAVVVGVANDIHGEEIIAAISLNNKNDNINDFKSTLYDLLALHLSSYKHPIDFIVVPEFPKTHSGKIMRRKVRAIVRQMLSND